MKIGSIMRKCRSHFWGWRWGGQNITYANILIKWQDVQQASHWYEKEDSPVLTLCRRCTVYRNRAQSEKKRTHFSNEGLFINVLWISFKGPPSPDLVHVQVTPGGALGIAVYWMSVKGAEDYLALTANGQNCTNAASNHCYISPVGCGQNHSVSVTAFNSAGPSLPSPPANYITCGSNSAMHTVYLTLFIKKKKYIQNRILTWL